MRSLRIGVDFDNVFVKSNKLKALYAQILFNRHIPSEIFRRSFVTNPSLEWLSEEQYRKIQKKMYEENIEATVRFLEPVSDAIISAKELLKEGHTLSCVTSHEGQGLKIAQDWLVRHKLPSIKCVGVGYGNTKAAAAKKLELEVFIDDDYPKIEDLFGIVERLFLLTWAYNKDVQIDTEKVRRVENWGEFHKEVRNLRNLSQD